MNQQIKARIEQIKRGEVPQGYKRTKIGVVPSGWEVKMINNIATISSGLTPNRSNKLFWNGNIPWLTTTLLNKDVINFANEYITQQALKDTSLKLIPKNTILMAMYGQGKTRGQVAILKFEATINQACAAIQVKQHNVNFIFFYLKSQYENIRNLSNIGNQENLNAEIIKSIKLPIPDISEQQKIADILTVQDKIIELKEKLIAEKQQQKKWLMQNLLIGKKRLNGFCGEWKEHKLGKLFDERIERHATHLPLLAITGTKGVIPRSKLDLKDNSSEDKSKYLKICVGDIGYNTMRMWQGVSAHAEYEGIVSPAYTILKTTDSINSKYFSYVFKMPNVVFMFYRFSQGLVDDTRSLKYSNFKQIKVYYPVDENEQISIAEILSTADREIELLQKDLAEEKQKKKALMQLLLTGIVRVNI